MVGKFLKVFFIYQLNHSGLGGASSFLEFQRVTGRPELSTILISIFFLVPLMQMCTYRYPIQNQDLGKPNLVHLIKHNC